jgi:flagellar biogenesis protein FliO
MIFFLLAQVQTSSNPFDDANTSLGWLFVKTLIAMVIVIALAFICIRYLLPRLQMAKQRGKSRIQIIERIGLEPRKALYIIKVGNKAAVVGSSDHNLSKLIDLDADDLLTEP